MDPGGSDLESSLPQAENPCLIVEDSQPDSVALEDDPDSSYRALLARRFSNLQPASHSPVLELISPSKGRCSQSDSQIDNAEGVTHADNLQANLSLPTAEHSQVFEVCTHPNTKRIVQEDMDSGADSTTHCVQTEEGTSQFGLLALSESQGVHNDGESSDEDVEATPANLLPPNSLKPAIQIGMDGPFRTSSSQDGRSRRPEVSSSSPADPQRRKLSVQAILHSQVPESVEAEDEEVVSSQDDLFDGEHNGSKVDSTVTEPEKQEPTSTPAHSLHLLLLSGHGTLVQESLSQQSVDFVAATQDGLSQAPIIVPNSPTGQDNAHEYDEAAESPMDTSGPPDAHGQKGEEELMDMDPVPKPTTSTPVSQNSPSFTLEKNFSVEKNLSLPTQPEFSHDVFVPTPCSESGDCSQSADSSKRNASQKASPSTEPGAETLKTPVASQSSEVTALLHLALDSENSIFDKKTQVFPMDDCSQDTQIEDVGGTVGVEEKDSGHVLQNVNSDKNSLESSLNKTASSQQVSERPDVERTGAANGRNEEICPSPKLCSPPGNGQDANVSGSEPEARHLPEAQSVSDTSLTPPAGEEGLGEGLTDSSRNVALPGGAVGSAHTNEPSQSQSVISPHKNSAMEEDNEGLSHQRPSQSMSQSHRINSAGNTEDVDQEEERMEEGEVQSTTRSEGSGLGLALSQSQAPSPEPMEEGGDCSEPVASGRFPVGVRGDDSFGITVLEESQRVSQEKTGLGPLQVLRSASQPLRVSPKETCGTTRKATSSQPSSSGPGSPTGSRDGIQAFKAGSGGGREGQSADDSANKNLSDSSEELPFHFTLPRDGELMGAAVSTTPPHIHQLKNTPLHSTPIETSSLRERCEGGVATETTMAASEISVEESAEGEEPTAKGGDGKLSLRMKVVSPVEEGNTGSECFSLQKPSLSDEEGSVSKATTVVKAVTSPSVFSRVREVHRQLQAEEEEEEEEESSSLPLRHPSRTAQSLPSTGETGLSPNRPLEAVGNSTAGGLSRAAHLLSQQPNGTVADAPSLASAGASLEPSAGGEQETPSTSGEALCGTPVRHRAVSQQTSADLTSTTVPIRKQIRSDVSGPQLSRRDEPVTPPRSHPGPSHRRHVRTVQEVRTTITRIITDVYYEDGREVERKVVEESEEPVVERCVVDGDVSPSRTGSSMTSGDLADVSSLSSKAPSHHSSSGTSSGGPGPSRAADFIMPATRGAKSGSPRRGGRSQPRVSMVAGSEFVGILGSPGAAAPLSPRGHARRGRPPSRATLSRGGRGGQRGGAHGLAASSSEEELVARSTGRASTPGRSDSLSATSPESSGGASSFVGLRVMAKWASNSYFYSGTITRDQGEGHFRVLFDDDQECEVQGRDILLCNPIPVGAEVTALTEEEYFNTGVVRGHKKQGSELLYCVVKDGQTTWYGRTAVILTMEQGNRLREQHGLGPYEPPTPPVMASDISLDNLVEGKRRRRGNGNGPGTPTRGSANSPRTPGKRKQESCMEEEKTPAKRGRRGGGARGGSRTAGCNTSGSGAELPADPDDLLLTHGPLPESTSLFMGFVFMLTSSSEHEREASEMDGMEDCVQTAPYNKRYTQRQLEEGGGMILPEFNEEQCKAAYQSLLIADQHCRTRTYLLCVAGGVPCVSQVWVRDCCQEKKLMNYRNYLLPAGLGPDRRIVEWHARCNPFKALKVLLFAETRADLWTSLLTMCGAAKVHHHKTNSSDVPAERFDVVVVSAHAWSPDALKSAANTPVVSLEWLVQSVICGERLAYDSQPEYQPDCLP